MSRFAKQLAYYQRWTKDVAAMGLKSEAREGMNIQAWLACKLIAGDYIA